METEPLKSLLILERWSPFTETIASKWLSRIDTQIVLNLGKNSQREAIMV